jgi:hypothetical protein
MEKSLWASPLKPKKIKEEKPPPTREEIQKKIQKLFSKPKCVISVPSAKKILNATRGDPLMAEWVERWIDDWVRGNSYPPQLRSNDFYSLLATYFDAQKVLAVLEQIRVDYHRAFPTTDTRPEDDDLAWLPPLLKADAMVASSLPPQYLD